DKDRGRLVGREHAVLAEIDGIDILALGDDREHHIDVGEVGQLVDDLAADFGEWFGFGFGAIPDRDVIAGLEEPLGHRIAHAAHADPSDPLRVRCHYNSSCDADVGVLLARPNAQPQCGLLACAIALYRLLASYKRRWA